MIVFLSDGCDGEPSAVAETPSNYGAQAVLDAPRAKAHAHGTPFSRRPCIDFG
jgi:hypothetical protein